MSRLRNRIRKWSQRTWLWLNKPLVWTVIASIAGGVLYLVNLGNACAGDFRSCARKTWCAYIRCSPEAQETNGAGRRCPPLTYEQHRNLEKVLKELNAQSPDKKALLIEAIQRRLSTYTLTEANPAKAGTYDQYTARVDVAALLAIAKPELLPLIAKAEKKISCTQRSQ